MKTKNKNAVALGRRGGKTKNAKLTKEQRNEMMAQVRASRWPEKIHTLKNPCPVERCKVTISNEHLNS
jgi:hypothetical protein